MGGEDVRYRPEVDGLRAVAVLPVILFHASPALVPGGFLGVDVFFVISGFLITGLLIEDLEAGRYSLARFYERRARRILPALLVVIAVTLVLAWALMLPRAFGGTARSAAAAAAFLSNVFFWQTTDYFDIDAIAQPLLHTWSLAVEEQYYIVFPVLLAAMWRRMPRRWIVAVIAALLLASLALAEWGAANHPKVNYYFTFSRFWELLAGSLAAFLMRYRPPGPNGVLAGVGLVGIVAAMALFRAGQAHPGVLTLIPVLATLALLIWGGAGGLAGRVLTLGPVVGIGKISYSLYLWHFPVFSFAVAQGPISAEPWNIALQIALTFALAVASWRYVETPLRHGVGVRASGRVLWVATGALGVTIALGQGLGQYPALTWRYLSSTADERAVLMFAETYVGQSGGRHLCFFNKGTVPKGLERCLPPERPNVVLWGDSHAASLAAGFVRAGVATGLLAGPGCGPLLDDGWTLQGECARANGLVMAALRQNPPTVLVLHAYWRNKRDQIRLLPATIAALRRDLPQTRIVVVGGMPYWLPSLPERIVAEGVVGRLDAMIPAQLDGVLRADDQLLAALGGDAAGVAFLQPSDLLCAAGRCRAYAGAIPFAVDYGHLTVEGAEDFVRAMVAGSPEVWRGVTLPAAPDPPQP